MDSLPDAGQDEEPLGVAPSQATVDGITVRKAPDLHGEEAVAVDFTLRSEREDHCVVRLTEILPEAVRDNAVEFHPGFDPSRWTRDEDTVVYEAPIGPGVTRRTVYGIIVDDPAQLELFTSPPEIETAEHTPAGTTGVLSDAEDTPAKESFEFGPGNGDGPTPELAGAPSLSTHDESPVDAGALDVPANGRVFESLLAEIRRGEVTEEEYDALREGLGLDEQLRTLRDRVEAIEAADREVADVDQIEARLESVWEELEARHDSLSTDIEAVEATLDREVRWRSQLRRTMATDPRDR